MKTSLTPILHLLCLIFSGCAGYHSGQGGIISEYRTVAVPFIEGDLDGEFTSILVAQLSRSCTLQYTTCHDADLLLEVVLSEVYDENIGFRHDRNKKGEPTSSLIPTETRIRADVEVSLIETSTCTTLLGPTCVTASVDFDHEYYSVRDEVNLVSLGQLTDIDAARDDVHRPLYRRLSKKIVDTITASW